jgi:hypothetical protein
MSIYTTRPALRPVEFWSGQSFADVRSERYIHEVEVTNELEQAYGRALAASNRYGRWQGDIHRYPNLYVSLKDSPLLTLYRVHPDHWWKPAVPSPAFVRLHELNWAGALRLTGLKLRTAFQYIEAATNLLAARERETPSAYLPTDDECLEAKRILARTSDESLRTLDECICDVQYVLSATWNDWEPDEELWINRRRPDTLPPLKPNDCDIRIDPKTFVVQSGNRRCVLGNGQLFQIFVRLHKRVGEPVPHEDLRNSVWGDDGCVDDGAIYKAVSDLRGELRKAGIEDLAIEGRKPRGHYVLLPKRWSTQEELSSG